MGIVKLNLAKTLDATASNSVFLDVPKDGEIRVRLLPPDEAMDGNIWYLTENHFRLKSEDGQKGIAVACNKRHGDGDCFLCNVAKELEASTDPQEKALGNGRESIKANRSWYVQVLPVSKDGSGQFVAGEPKLLRLPKTAADAVNSILQSQQRNDDGLSCNPEPAQDIIIKRKDTGVAITKYEAMPTGKAKSLDELFPDWATKMMSASDVWSKLDLKIMSNEQQREVLLRSYEFLDVDTIAQELGYV